MVFRYAPGRGKEHAAALLAGYRGILQCDGYAAYKALATGDGAITDCVQRLLFHNTVPRSGPSAATPTMPPRVEYT